MNKERTTDNTRSHTGRSNAAGAANARSNNARPENARQRRRLRLELLETRSLLTAAPWAVYEVSDAVYLDSGATVELNSEELNSEVIGQDQESRFDRQVRRRGETHGHGKRPGKHARASDHHVFQREFQSEYKRGMRPQFESSAWSGSTGHGRGRAHTSAWAADEPSLTPAITTEILFVVNAQDHAGSAGIHVAYGNTSIHEVQPNNEIVVRISHATLPDRVLDEVALDVARESEMKDRRYETSREIAPHEVLLGSSHTTMQTPGQTGGVERLRGESEPELPDAVVLRGGDVPSIENRNSTLFDFSVEAESSFALSGNGALALNSSHEAQWMRSQASLGSGPSRDDSLSLALESLFEDSPKTRGMQDLDQLLDSLSDEHRMGQRAANGVGSSAAGELPSVNPPVESHAGPEDDVQSRRLLDPSVRGGMIAMQLPEDLLPGESGLLAENAHERSETWTARVGLYRSHEMSVANGARAVVAHPANVGQAWELRSMEAKAEETVVSRLRPIVAATSAAFGVIFIGLRRHQRKSKNES